jgi:carotenoid 1,2-hydratase
MPDRGPRFDIAVPPDGYAWWYVDALSDDLRYGLTIIAFIGNVFSPYYAWARRRGPADPGKFCCLNVALYGARRRWAMTERGAGALRRGPTSLAIGPSALEWDGTALTITIAERGAPLPRRVRGTVRLLPEALERRAVRLDPAGRHRWSPFAPCARVEVTLLEPALSWSGAGYWDGNDGDAPLERDFAAWSWMRAPLADGAVVLYDVRPRDGEGRCLALRFASVGGVTALPEPGVVPLPPTLWRVSRSVRAEAARLVRTLEDAPFYARSVVEVSIDGQRALGVHESLSLDRFRAPWVQALLPFRMPRQPFG